MWLYQTQGLFTICAPDTDVTDDSHGDCSLTAGYTHKKSTPTRKKKQKKKNKQKESDPPPSFNLVGLFSYLL